MKQQAYSSNVEPCWQPAAAVLRPPPPASCILQYMWLNDAVYGDGLPSSLRNEVVCLVSQSQCIADVKRRLFRWQKACSFLAA